MRESNANYGENLMLLDHAFGTFTYSSYRAGPGRRVGIGRTRYRDGECFAIPKSLPGQVTEPLRRAFAVGLRRRCETAR